MLKYKIISFICIILTLLSLTACNSVVNAKASNLTTSELLDSMLKSASSLPDMTRIDSNNDDEAEGKFAIICDFDYSKVDSYSFTYSSEGKANEICVVKLKDEDDTNELINSFKKRIKTRTNLYKTYNPTEEKIASNGLVFSKQRFVSLVISQAPSKIKDSFYNNLE